MKCIANNKPVKITTTGILPPPYNETRKCYVAKLITEGLTEIEAEFDKPVDSVTIRPLSLKISAEIKDNKVRFVLDRACNISVEINDCSDDSLLIFADEKKEYNLSAYENVITFEAGNHIIDEMRITKDSTVVFLEDGAVVNGRIVTENADKVKICGTGIITMKNYTRSLREEMTRAVDILNCQNIDIEDVCIFDSCNWSLRLNGCDNAKINNVKIIGHRGNADGIDVCGSRNVYVSGCFARSWDDGFVVKGFDTGNVENVVFEKSTLWNDVARPIEVGVEMRCEEVKNVIFRDIDVIHSMTCYPIFGIHHGDRAKVSDIHFENIRVENAPGAQLFDFRITDSIWNKDAKKGSIENVYVNDIFIVGDEGKDFRNFQTRIDGFSEEHSIKNVYIGNIEAFGKKITGKEMLGLDIVGAVKNVVLEEKNNPGIIKSEIRTVSEFTLKNDGKYHGTVALKFKNTGDKDIASIEAGIKVFPKNKAICDEEKLICRLAPGEEKVKEYDIITTAGKLAVESCGDAIEFKPSIEFIDLPYLFGSTTENAPVLEFNNYYGDDDGKVAFSVNNGWLEVKSELLKKYDICVYAAMPVPRDDNQILFSTEESYMGEAPSVKWKNGQYMSAPEIGNHWEITLVFGNNPKVKEIKKAYAEKNIDGMMKIPLSSLGLENDVEHFWLEATLCKPTKYQFPYTLFRSTYPEGTAHMFCDFIRKK